RSSGAARPADPRGRVLPRGSPGGGGGLTTSGAPNRNARDPSSCAGPERSGSGPGHRCPADGQCPRGGKGVGGGQPFSVAGWGAGGRAGPAGCEGGGWGSVVLRGGLRCRAELGEQLRHLGVGLVAVGDQLRGGLLVVVAEQSLAVLDALAVRGDRVGEDLRRG